MNNSNTNSNSENEILSLVHKSTVPKAFRPETDDEIDAMLDEVGTSLITIVVNLGQADREKSKAEWHRCVDEIRKEILSLRKSDTYYDGLTCLIYQIQTSDLQLLLTKIKTWKNINNQNAIQVIIGKSFFV